MSVQLIQQYHNQVERIIRYGGSRKETAVRKPFHDLLEAYARQKNLELIGELDYRTPKGRVIMPDGTLKDALRQDWGYWEAKDEDDDLDREIAKKIAKGYPTTNILFEDTQTAVLYQANEEVGRVDLKNAQALHELLTRYVSYESAEVRAFREAIEAFTEDVPNLAEELRGLIREQYETNPKYRKQAEDFLELCQEAINPSMEKDDVREMIVQHVLTEDIFITVFEEPQFHRENIIARELGEVVNTFYKGRTRRLIDARIEGYTQAIKARAAQIYNHQEKQKFLKVLYENFYKAYNPKAADRLGIVYTPNEIVRFMIESADYLCHKHFGKTLGSQGVEILDPATGTGTYITELIEYLPKHQLEYKYKNELHCNEVSILPYYIANLNIEFTYKQKMGRYEPFENVLFVDTLDNLGFGYEGKQLSLFGLTDENLERIRRQNERDISVIIGNPPYNANQLNENNNNKNRLYPAIDRRIRNTYVSHSTAQKTNVYDMYTRFYRWATDRIGKEGIVAFVTNRSFVNARGYDGFRKSVSEEFSHIYIVDLGGDVRKNPKLSGPRNNVFAIQTGVAVAFMVRAANQGSSPCKIRYARRPEMELAVDKLRFLATNSLSHIDFENVTPSEDQYWIALPEESWDDLLRLIPTRQSDSAIFYLSSNGINSSRDEWVYDFDREKLSSKIRFFIDEYNHEVKRWMKWKEVNNYTDSSIESNPVVDDFLHARNLIKWSSRIKRDKLRKGKLGTLDPNAIRNPLYRPYVSMYFYCDYIPIDLFGQQLEMFPETESLNRTICFTGKSSAKPFQTLASDEVAGYDLLEKTRCVPRYRFDNFGNRVDNITDWALAQFREEYDDQTITKEDIFHYVYAVLHNPTFREKYRLNLKRDFPRIPFYDDFHQWANWGKQLMDLHLNYETVDPYPLQRTDLNPDETRKAYKAMLKADKEKGLIQLDTYTTLSGVPAEGWTYMLGNRSAIEWILDRHKEKKPRDPTIREKFNTYRFADYKEHVIDLLQRVTTVSVETMKIIDVMPAEEEN